MWLPRWLSDEVCLWGKRHAGDAGLIPGWGRAPGVGNGKLRHYSCPHEGACMHAHPSHESGNFMATSLSIFRSSCQSFDPCLWESCALSCKMCPKVIASLLYIISVFFFFFLILFIYLLLFFLLYNIVLVLPYINTHPPWVYTCSPSWAPLPPPSPYHPSGSSQCTSPKLPVSCIEPGLAIHFLSDIIHILMPFSQLITPPHRVQKTVLYICVSFSVMHTGLSLPSL